MTTFKFEKKGYEFLIEVEGTSCIMKVDGLELKAKPGQHPKAGWNYKVISPDLAEKLAGKRVKKQIAIMNDTAKEAAYLIEENKQKEQEIECNKELTFKAQEAVLDRDWGVTSLVLIEQKELLSDEQREAVYELKELLGETALFAGATKYINAKELPVEEGKEYTLEEIMEMLKDTEQYQVKIEKEIAEEEKYNEVAEEARKTGKNVEYKRYSVPCNDPNEECNIDIVTVYVTPSGRTKEVRNHTW